MGRNHIWIGATLALLLGGCIPSDPSRERPAPAARPADAAPAMPVDLLDLPDSPPTWEARPVTAEARTVAGGTYRVVAGDSLRAIAERTGAGSEAIARANGLSPPFVIHPGQTLTIPAGRYHRIRQGETGIAIARAYGVSWSRIVDLNALEEPYILRTGMLLVLPAQAEAQAMTMEERAAAFRVDIGDIVTGGEPAIAANAPAPRQTAAAIAPSQPVVAPGRLSGRFDWPLSGTILQRFGPVAPGRVNNGVRIGVPRGTPIKAAADGVVAYAGDDIAIYGGLVLIKHGDQWVTAYGHAEKLAVARGQSVKRGTVIGYAGETGSARESQLYFEMRRDRTPVDPLKQLPPR